MHAGIRHRKAALALCAHEFREAFNDENERRLIGAPTDDAEAERVGYARA